MKLSALVEEVTERVRNNEDHPELRKSLYAKLGYSQEKSDRMCATWAEYLRIRRELSL